MAGSEPVLYPTEAWWNGGNKKFSHIQLSYFKSWTVKRLGTCPYPKRVPNVYRELPRVTA